MIHVGLARIVRSGFIEGIHYGSAIVLDPFGKALIEAGDPHAPVFLRSAAKPLQAIAMVSSGFALDDLSLMALAAGSHSGEAMHIDGVRRILGIAGLDESDLQNVPDLPLDPTERLQWQLGGRQPSRLAQNCSGQHAAMLVTCMERGWRISSYLDVNHPLQTHSARAIEELTGEKVSASGIDGCGVPTFAISLRGLALAFSRVATAEAGSPEDLIAKAFRRRPEWIGGASRNITKLLVGVDGLIAKEGAEAVFAAALPDGTAMAVKISDGNIRAQWPVSAMLLRKMGVEATVLTEVGQVPIMGHGKRVGGIEAVEL